MLGAMNRLFAPAAADRRFSDIEFRPCSFVSVSTSSDWTVAGLFAGIGGIELGLERVGMQTELLCEWWDPARAVLEHRFDGVPVEPDVRELEKLPPVDLVTAGFPCTDLSQAGRMKGITGEASGLVGDVFRLLRGRPVPWVLLENVRNMLVLDGGRAMRFLVEEFESLGYRWAYRLVDSRFTGVAQRRQRVIFLASLEGDPREVLFADEAGEPSDEHYLDDVYGFYWTEGFRGLGWARDAVPTLKGGSTIGIPSPPAIWNRAAPIGQRIVTPTIDEAERLQGFAAGWTEPADLVSGRKGTRWKLVGNAVTVGVSEWVAGRLAGPGSFDLDVATLRRSAPWPKAACGANGKRWVVDASMWPIQAPYEHLGDVVDLASATPLSTRATAGFLDRARRGTLRMDQRFLDDLASHVDKMDFV